MSIERDMDETVSYLLAYLRDGISEDMDFEGSDLPNWLEKHQNNLWEFGKEDSELAAFIKIGFAKILIDAIKKFP